MAPTTQDHTTLAQELVEITNGGELIGLNPVAWWPRASSEPLAFYYICQFHCKDVAQRPKFTHLPSRLLSRTKMADPVGVTASLIAITSLATKIAHQLDQMIQSYFDAPDVFKSFCSNFKSARSILEVVRKTLQDFNVNESIHGVDFEEQLQDAISGVDQTLTNVNNCLGGVRRLERGNRWAIWDRVRVLWDEDQLDKWDKILDRQVNKLSGLLNAYVYLFSYNLRATSDSLQPNKLSSPFGSGFGAKWYARR